MFLAYWALFGQCLIQKNSKPCGKLQSIKFAAQQSCGIFALHIICQMAMRVRLARCLQE